MNCCEECVFYKKHYVKNRGEFKYVYWGHCIVSRSKKAVRYSNKACEKFGLLDKEKGEEEERKSVRQSFCDCVKRIDKLIDFIEAEE